MTPGALLLPSGDQEKSYFKHPDFTDSAHFPSIFLRAKLQQFICSEIEVDNNFGWLLDTVFVPCLGSADQFVNGFQPTVIIFFFSLK